MNRTAGSSIVLVLAILWQVVLACFTVDAAAAAPVQPRIKNEQDKAQQLSMTAGALPVLIGGKRAERLSKGEPPHESFNTVKSNSCYSASTQSLYLRQIHSMPFPVKKGYWLIYRELLL